MQHLSLGERARIAAMSVDRSRRAALSRLLSSPLLRWRYASRSADQLLIVPQDLRTADASFMQEVRLGQFGLAGSTAMCGDMSPFDFAPPTPAWDRALNGFSWLRHLDAAGDEEAEAIARQLVQEWIARSRSLSGPAAEPTTTARRLISWLSHASLLLDDADQKGYDDILDSLDSQLVQLSASWRDAPPGYPRLLSLIALTLAGLCVAGHDHTLPAAARSLANELQRQILPDGGHVSRNAAVLVELMLDLLPLRQCFAARDRPAPEAIDAAMRRILPMLRYMRMGDGMLARFNGVGVATPVGLATVLAYDDMAGPGLAGAPESHYFRIDRGATTVIFDGGPPPPLVMAGEAHAGCLSFELSVGTRLMMTNGGAPSPADADWRPASRASASHNTVSIADTSSSRLIRHRVLEEMAGAPPILGPETVTAKVDDVAGGARFEGSHDGYRERHGYLHRRRVVIAADGHRVEGHDHLEPMQSRRVARLPFAVHFHLHPDVVCRRILSAADSAEIELADAGIWRFSAEGARLGVEESIFFADSAGPRRSLQIVLRGSAGADASVRWLLERIP